jgi:hypothetical protein
LPSFHNEVIESDPALRARIQRALVGTLALDARVGKPFACATRASENKIVIDTNNTAQGSRADAFRAARRCAAGRGNSRHAPGKGGL